MTKCRILRALLLAGMALPLAATELRAQSQDAANAEQRPCGVEDSLQAERVFSVLASTKSGVQEALRAGGFEPQSPAATRGVLRLTNVCAVLRAALAPHLDPVDVPIEGLSKAEWRFFVLGDYLGVQVVSGVPPTNGIQRRGPSGVYIFRRPLADGDDVAMRSRVEYVGRLSA